MKLDVAEKPEVKTEVHIRWMKRGDMKEVLEIEKGSFEFPWNEKDFMNALLDRICIGMVAQYEDCIVGFMIYELRRKQIAVLDFCVDPEFRRGQVGRQMAERLIGKLSHDRRNRINFEIRESNLAAQQFLKAMGFQSAGILPEYYDETGEDAYVFRYSLQGN